MTTIIPHILAQHAEEAAFHWLLRDQAVTAPHYSLRDLADLDARLDAHVDGLRIAGAQAWPLVAHELAWEEPGEVFVGAVLAFESNDPLRIEEALAVGAQSLELARGIISALGWLPLERALPHIRGLLESDDPLRQRAAIGALAVHRHDPGAELGDWATLSSPQPRARALRAIGELGRTTLVGHCTSALREADPEVRFWAAWSAARLGAEDGARALYEIIVTPGQRQEAAVDLLTRRLPPGRALGWHRQLARDGNLRLACRVAGTAGDPVTIPWLIETMSVDAAARAAGEAFARITGVDLAYEDLERDAPADFQSGPTENAEDEDVALDADEDLPWPDPELVAVWWAQNGSRFTPGTRYLLGQPVSPASLADALRSGTQRQRTAAALELAVQASHTPLFETRARGDWQLRALRRG